MNRTPATFARYLSLVLVLGLCPGCVTPTDATATAGSDGTVVATNTRAPETTTGDAEDPVVVMQESGVAGRSESGEKIYCRKSTKSGSRIMQKVCMTEEQRRKHQEYSKEILKNSDRIGLISHTSR